jgi:hypothetical protein
MALSGMRGFVVPINPDSVALRPGYIGSDFSETISLKSDPTNRVYQYPRTTGNR